MTTKLNDRQKEILHILRNPYGFKHEAIRDNARSAANEIESLCQKQTKRETIFDQHMKNPEFAKAMFKQDLMMAITEAICETLNSYGFEQSETEDTCPERGKLAKKKIHCAHCGHGLIGTKTALHNQKEDKLKRSELIKTQCWSCWFCEGGFCHSEDFGKVPKDGIFYVGYEITPAHINICKSSYVNKRSIFGKTKNVTILSEHT